MPKMIGLRCDIVGNEDIFYLVFYDIDRQITDEDKAFIDSLCRKFDISYILYSTKNGVHFVGLTPVTIYTHHFIFAQLKMHFDTFYGGIVIRLSRKKDEQQQLIHLEESYGEVIPNLFNLYAKKFGLQKKPWSFETTKYRLVFEKYKTVKE